MTDIKKLKQIDSKILNLKGIVSLLSFDQQTLMPKKAAKERAEQIALLSVEIHKLMTGDELFETLQALKEKKSYRKLSILNKAYVDKFLKEVKRIRKLPEEFVEEFSRLTSNAHMVWEEAKQKNDFELFKPYLEKIVEMSRQKAKLIDSTKNPYDVLMYDYEKELTTKKVDEVFIPLKKEIISLLEKIKKSKNYNKETVLKNVSFENQMAINKKIAELVLEKKQNWAFAQSIHPFTTTISPSDVRITTKVLEDNPLSSFTSTAHESGHALYELNFGKNIKGTFLAHAAGLGVHESQSRLWENQVFKSEDFWNGFYEEYKDQTGLDLSKEDFFLHLNKVKPNLIRVEADELTYGLHIIIRYELERDLMNQKLEVKDLQKAWNNKYKEYLGLDVPNDSLGVLQDVHWSSGYIGYFPTYLIGSIYSATIFNTIKKKNSNLQEEIKNKDFSFIRTWLKHNIHSHGATLLPEDLIEYACGSGLTPKDYVNYLNDKYKKLYDL
ncbi:MAG: carboxypeptidase M32 [Candidatus Woesearchaeota archaeon]